MWQAQYTAEPVSCHLPSRKLYMQICSGTYQPEVEHTVHNVIGTAESSGLYEIYRSNI